MEVLAILIASFIISEVATVLLTFTGLDRETAKFQSLSALTGTGFTTKEAEQMLQNKQRRQIITVLMILGKAGVVLLIAGVIRQYESHFFSLKILGYVVFFYITFKIMTTPKVVFRIGKWIEAYMEKRGKMKKRRLEELLHMEAGYGVAELNITGGNGYTGKKISDTSLREQDILILSIEHDGEVTSLPRANHEIRDGDILTCYGKMESIRQLSKKPEKVGK
ncbi:MAG: TrkA C-terminal domain-containing protein [Candidatus Margulisiibacteriota bacterium]